MLKKKRFWQVMIIVLVGFGIIGSVVYNSLFIHLFGFQIRKSQLQTIMVYSDQHAYYVHNAKLVEQIIAETAALDRYNRIVPGNFPQYKVYAAIPKFLVQTKDHNTFGGTIWADGHIMDANGYYWNMPPQLLELLSKSIQDNETEKIF
jgi:hypothetical protein